MRIVGWCKVGATRPTIRITGGAHIARVNTPGGATILTVSFASRKPDDGRWLTVEMLIPEALALRDSINDLTKKP